MLAANRTDKVKGRMTLLVSSIKTMKGIRAGGVPMGTRWASMFCGVFSLPINMCPTQRGKARPIAKVRCLEEVKIKGNSPIKLLSKINKNSLIGKYVNPGAAEVPIIELNSWWRVEVNDFSLLVEEDGRAQTLQGIRDRTKTLDSQFVGNPNLAAGSKTENKLFIYVKCNLTFTTPQHREKYIKRNSQFIGFIWGIYCPYKR